MAETVLVVDDQPVMLDMLKELLQMMGYEACTASSALEGLRRLYERRPDLVITDLWMPGMDGLEFSRIVRCTCDVPIMMLTALGGVEANIYELNLVDDYLEKPVAIDELADRVAALLQSRKMKLASPSRRRKLQVVR